MQLTAKQEKYCQNIAQGMTQSDAYRNAYDVDPDCKPETVWTNACQLASDTKVSQRIEELRKELQESLKYDREAHFRELDIYKAKYEESNPSACVKTLELKGKLCGLYTDKVEMDAKHTGGITVKIVTGGKE